MRRIASWILAACVAALFAPLAQAAETARLVNPVTLDVIVNDKKAGQAKVKAGSEIQIVARDGDRLLVRFKSMRGIVSVADTDLDAAPASDPVSSAAASAPAPASPADVSITETAPPAPAAVGAAPTVDFAEAQAAVTRWFSRAENARPDSIPLLTRELQPFGDEAARGILVRLTDLSSAKQLALAPAAAHAIRSLASDQQVMLVGQLLRSMPALIPVAVDRNWDSQLKPLIFEALTKTEVPLSSDIFIALAKDDDRQISAMLASRLFSMEDPFEILEAIADQAPGTGDAIIVDFWNTAQSRDPKLVAIFQTARRDADKDQIVNRAADLAARCGSFSALDHVYHNMTEARRPVDFRKTFTELTGAKGGSFQIKDWFDTNRPKLSWDPNARRYIVRS